MSSPASDKRALLARLLQQKRATYSYPLSYGQQALWFIYQNAPDSPAYNMAFPLELEGNLSLTALQQALQALVNRHSILRTTIAFMDGEPEQTVHPTGTYQWDEHQAVDWSSEQLETTLKRAYEQRFDLTNGPVLRADLFQTAQERHILLLTMHHIFGDASSMAILGHELLTLYESELKGQKAALPIISTNYADFVRAESALLDSSEGERLAHYWQQQLAGQISLLNLPTDYPRPAIQSYNGASVPFSLPAHLSQQLKQLAQQEKTTLFSLLLTAFQIILHRYTGQNDIWLGTPTSTSRRQPQFANLVGYLVNPVVIRATIDSTTSPSFRELLSQTKQTVVEAIDHSAYPFPLLVKTLQPQRDLSYAPLFQVMLDFQPTNEPFEREIAGLTISMFELFQMEGQFDVTLSVTDGACISGAFRYNPDLFQPETIERMVGHLQTLLTGIVANPDHSITELPILTEVERHQILIEWNDTARDYPTNKTIHQFFEEQVDRTPDKIALVFPSLSPTVEHQSQIELTYAELNRRANQLAHYLQNLGVGPDVLVGICMERSIEMVIGLLGILKAGGAYVPLDPTYPAERLGFMVVDANVPVLLTQEHLRDTLPETTASIICLDSDWTNIQTHHHENLNITLQPHNLAYMIYTSGSTGQPKGTMNYHQAIFNRLVWMQEEYQLTSVDKILQKTPFSFDVSVWEFFWPLMYGAQLIMARPEGHKDPQYLIEIIKQQGITTIHFVPSMLQIFVEAEGVTQCISLKRIICSGEALPYDLMQRCLSRLPAQLHNLYGPTEAAVDVSYWPCQADYNRQLVPIGRPVANTQLYILDTRLEPVPIGILGELHIGGVQLARGYHNRPQLTAEKFIPNPYGEGRLYKTGDLARWLPDGNIEFIGRLDHQVKIRGFRIELGEIETILSHHEIVQEVVVIAKELGIKGQGGGERKQLVAYLVLSSQPPNPELLIPEIRDSLKENLPDYMIPHVFMVLEQFPLTPNGKIDRKSLPEPNTVSRNHDHLIPRDSIELRLVQIWEKLFRISPISVQDDFFEIGGDSLLAMRLMAKIEQEFGTRIPLHTVFHDRTIEQLACILRHDFVPPAWSPLLCLQPHGSKPPIFFIHASGGSAAFNYLQIADLMGTERPFYAVQPRGMEPGEPFHDSIEEMAADYVTAVCSVQDEGPYLLAGWSFGGLVGFEMARLLEQAGKTVPFLIMIDTPSPFANNVGVEDDVEFLLERLPFFHLKVSLDKLELQKTHEEKVNYMLEEMKIGGLLRPDIDDQDARHWLNLYKHHNKLVDFYTPKSHFNGKIIFFRPAEEIPFDVKMGDPMDWDGFAYGGLQIQDSPGNHFNMVSPVNTPILVSKIQECIK